MGKVKKKNSFFEEKICTTTVLMIYSRG